jgi:predicted DCC family thiol-disulfide oxidoreductase YuxK
MEMAARSESQEELLLDERQALMLYDGVCGLCDRVVQFVLARDHDDRFRFAPLQGPTAARVLARHGIDAGDLDTFHLVLDVGRPTERVVSRGRGAAVTLKRLGGAWRALGVVLAVLPRPLVDLGYRMVARVRYRVWGRADQCVLPSPQQRAKFLA